MILSLILCLVFASCSVKSNSDYADQFKGLKFADDGYILFQPDMSPFVNEMSVCTWLRDVGSNSNPTVFNYGPINRFRFDSNGGYNCVANQCHLDVRSKLTVAKGSWYHACLTWGTTSRSLRYYADGTLLGTMATDTTTLTTGHKVVLGNHANVLNDRYAFGGEMNQLNAYAKELTAQEIRRMADAGMCSLTEDENEDVRVLKWEEILKKSRTGTVTDLYPSGSECVKTLITRLTAAERKVNEAEEQLLATQQTLEATQQTLEQTLEENEEIEQTLNQTQTKLNTAELEIQDISSNLTRTSDKLQMALEQLEQCNRTTEIWDWDLFFQDSYVNTTISPEVAKQLRIRWDDIAGK